LPLRGATAILRCPSAPSCDGDDRIPSGSVSELQSVVAKLQASDCLVDLGDYERGYGDAWLAGEKW
jgi:hypothetical protein